MRVAAIQLEVALGDVASNLAESERLIRAAASDGAELVSLPEFFTTGVVFLPQIAEGALPPEGPATGMLTRLAAELGIWIGGSFLCRDSDGECRNAWLLAGPDGRIRGRHDKDLPTMWENAFYIGGSDDGVIEADGFAVGAAVCWEFMRSATARRLAGRVDLIMGGSNWWSVPAWPPRSITARMESANARNARQAPAGFAALVGAPVVHGAICGGAVCPMPELPFVTYRGRFEGGALVADATGRIIAWRDRAHGSGHAIAEVEIGPVTPSASIPGRYWLHSRGLLPALTWHSQRWAGRRWYRRHVRSFR
jgi:predicted amidohydrolase